MSRLPAANADDTQPTLHSRASCGTDQKPAPSPSHRGGEASPAVLRCQYQRHRRSFRGSQRITQPYTRDRGQVPFEIDPHAQAGNAFLPTRRFRNGGERIRSYRNSPLRVWTPRRSPKRRTHQRNHTRRERGQRSRCGRLPSLTTNSVPASLEAPNEPATDPKTIPNSRTVWGLLILKEEIGMKVTAACLPRSTNIGGHRRCEHQVAAANPTRPQSRLSSHFPNPSKSSFFAIGRGRGPNTAHLVGRQEYSKRN